ncbi:MAG: hypothetical protein QG555_1385 [Thermodesulfobacteriota bacterium]|jgi:hypothetical protein|nr:hypothetical protein [Thermodesulfobacteriota bacterium]
MSCPRTAAPVNLIMSLIATDGEKVCQVLAILKERFGETDYLSPYLPFNYTNYYEKEMGQALVRRFISFGRHVPPETLPDIKNWTNELEEQFSEGKSRQVNIDPGYIAPAHLILATGKGYTHRPYLRDGIYADLTMIYCDGSFRSLPWSYPDYASAAAVHMLNIIRKKYLWQLKKIRKEAS